MIIGKAEDFKVIQFLTMKLVLIDTKNPKVEIELQRQNQNILKIKKLKTILHGIFWKRGIYL